MQLKKNPQLDALNKQAVSRTTMQLKTNPQLDALNKQAASSEKNLLPDKKSKSCLGTLLRITFICVPVVMILATNTLLFFSGCGGKAKLSEAKQYVRSMNKSQKAKYAEDGAFSNSVNALDLGIKTQTTNYNYSTISTKNAAFSYAVARSNNLTSYVGAVFLVPVSQAANKEKTTVSILCAANSPGNTQPPAPILQKGNPVCAAGTESLAK
ncbi:type IV pilin-like G/H family protein [Microcoleus vaginatus DQ-U2]|uniref:type IV pilin-like G/H family protein n=1 Tax=Microcoleus vaginatus TaxID=119532 RepID=UPI001687F9D2|nr:type IV pilin-like G/H family protein [Microcoleus sp. FACHB-DQ6]